ncbi:MAG TPA: AGE family epimerase/isomerase [Opitutaceae bacterium]|jgi:mannobiose 2-epimerase
MRTTLRIAALSMAAALTMASLSRAEPSPSPAERQELAGLASQTQDEVRGDILPWWIKYAPNEQNKGIQGFIGADMTVRPDADRGALLTSRILWTFSTAYRIYHNQEYLDMARWAYRDLVDHFVDPQYGGLYWTITADGRPKNTVKQIYGQAFGIYALAEYYRATGDNEALAKALGIYALIEKHAWDREHGGYYDALGRDWGRLEGKNLLGPAPKSQNSHIHILEAYTELLRVWRDPGLLESQRDLIRLTLDRIIDPKTHHLILFMKDDWTPVGDHVSYGHDIELSWLIVEAANVVGDQDLIARARKASVEIANATLTEGIDKDGGVPIEGGPNGYIDRNKEWWEQAEAMVGFLNAYQISGEPRFLEASRNSWHFIETRLIDRVHGDWLMEVTPEGKLAEVELRDGRHFPMPKLDLWKCPYHSGRSCFEVDARVREILGGGPQD